MVSPARPRGVTATGPSTPRLKMPVFPDFLAPSMGTSAPTLTLSRRKLALQGCAVAGDPVDVVDVGDAPDLAYYLLYVLHARGFESEPAKGCPVLDSIDPRGDDVHAGVRDRSRYILQQVHPVEGFDEQLDGEELVRTLGPFDLDKPLGVPGLERPGVHAAGRMDYYAAPKRDVTHDLVARHRGAATRQARQDPARPDDPHPGLLVGFALGQGERGERRALVPGPFLFFLWLYLLDYATCHVLGRENAGTHGGEHVVGR